MHQKDHDTTGERDKGAEMVRISEREQESIGRVLHDDLGQKLAAASYMSHALAGALASSGSAHVEQATALSDLLTESQSLTRALARGLHPPKLNADQLTDALNSLAKETSSIFHTDCTFETTRDIDRLFSDETADQLHHIVCEAVRNSLHHGMATQIRIRLDFRGDTAFLTIGDNGVKTDPGKCNSIGIGMQIMKNRAEMCGGSLGISNAPGGGTIVTCSVPTRSHHWGLSDFIV
jgi:signal transduction histidine kinase